MAISEVVLGTKGLVKRFGSLLASDDISLEVKRGEIHAVIGPNGAGKTTLIKQLNGEILPDTGQIWLNGTEITSMPIHARARLGLARSFQITSLLPSFTVLDNVALAVQGQSGHSFHFWGLARQDPTLNTPALGTLQMVGLADRASAQVSTLSHGEKRLLEIAIALAMNPQVLLLDEPMAGVGSEESERIVELLHTLKGNYSILLIEHDMDAVFSLADRITVLVYGRVIANGSPEAIRLDPQVKDAYLGHDDESMFSLAGIGQPLN